MTVVMSFLYGSYFTTIIVYCQFYFFNSFNEVLPWSTCHKDIVGDIVGDEIIGDNITSLHRWATENCTDSTMNRTTYSVPVTQEYFDNVLLKKTSGIEEVKLQCKVFMTQLTLQLASWH